GGECLVQVGDLLGTGENAAGAAHVLDLGRAPPGRDQRPGQPRQSSIVRPAKRVEAAAVLDDAVDYPLVHGRAAEPQRRPARPERLRLDPHVAEPVMPPAKAHGGGGPGSRPNLELLVENVTSALERDAQRLVLIPVPADRGLHDEPAVAE